MEDLGSLNPICLQPAHSESIGPVVLMLTDAKKAVGIWARHVAKLSSLVECPIQYKLALFFFLLFCLHPHSFQRFYTLLHHWHNTSQEKSMSDLILLTQAVV